MEYIGVIEQVKDPAFIENVVLYVFERTSDMDLGKQINSVICLDNKDAEQEFYFRYKPGFIIPSWL